jgi:hypothetical protein
MGSPLLAGVASSFMTSSVLGSQQLLGRFWTVSEASGCFAAVVKGSWGSDQSLLQALQINQPPSVFVQPLVHQLCVKGFSKTPACH